MASAWRSRSISCDARHARDGPAPRRGLFCVRAGRRWESAPYVGGTSSLALIHQAAARDWEKVVAALPNQADRDALARRVAEMRQLAKFAELATLPHIDTSINDKNARTVKLLRTEAKGVVAAKPQKGKAYDYSMRPSESYS